MDIVFFMTGNYLTLCAADVENVFNVKVKPTCMIPHDHTGRGIDGHVNNDA